MGIKPPGARTMGKMLGIGAVNLRMILWESSRSSQQSHPSSSRLS